MLERIRDVLLLSKQMLERAEASNWEDFKQLQQARALLLEETAKHTATAADSAEIRLVAEEIQTIDNLLVEMATGVQKESSSALQKLRKSSKAISAYQQP